MSWVEYGAYAGILGGAVYLLLLFAFRDSFASRNKVSWIIQLEMAIFMVLMGFMVWGTRSGSVPSMYLGAMGWVWLIVVIVTVLVGFKEH
ncbi:hypothetical protein E3E23_03805 [Thermococcus sp. CX2]|uniref:hypothetical protein n=1 Tax=Thermococcus sp. CX2 TaxID=163006 RepID=UPI001439037F|nr:hypothetical protein [Thermococcus sp. CX2]NJE84955.1 hypothetical protein [Thermococcus sp. CX2]